MTAAEIRTRVRELKREVAKLPFDALGTPASRAKALVVTKLDEACLWLAAYEAGGVP